MSLRAPRLWPPRAAPTDQQWLRRVGSVVIGISLLPLLYTVFDTSDGDIPLYHHFATILFAGRVPYRDFPFEYPPYTLALFGLPGLFKEYGAFRIAFSLQLLAFDVWVKWLLLREGERIAGPAANTNAAWGARLRPLLPVILYSLGTWFQAYFYLKRIDLPAAALLLFALLSFRHNRPMLSGACLCMGTGLKLFPVLVGPALAFLSWKRGDARRFMVGLGLGALPALLAAPLLPWWQFANFHVGRGLQVESLDASLIWLVHFVGVPAEWAARRMWMDVDGPLAQAILPTARVLFGVATVATSLGSVFIANRLERAHPATLAQLARLALVPILAFMAFNVVFSTQYMIWLLGLLALGSWEGRRAPMVTLFVAVVLSTFVFPAPGYLHAGEGLGVVHTVILVARNVAILVALGGLLREALERWKRERRHA